jgi:hypothetical protein
MDNNYNEVLQQGFTLYRDIFNQILQIIMFRIPYYDYNVGQISQKTLKIVIELNECM